MLNSNFITLFFQTAQMEKTSSSPRPQTPSTLTETEVELEGSLLEVDLDSYQTTLEEVLTWLLEAEDTLIIQEDVSTDVEEVKEQFHTHEVGRGPRADLGQGDMNEAVISLVHESRDFSWSGNYMLHTWWECQEFVLSSDTHRAQ